MATDALILAPIPSRLSVAVGMAMLAIAVPGFAGSWQVTPSVTASETYSTNLALTAVAPEAGWMTGVAPGIRIDGHGAKIDGYLDYRRDYLFYHGNSQWDRHQNLLNSYASYEAINNWLYIDASANIGQRNLSVFGPISTAGTNVTAEQVETKTTQVAPYIRGRVGSDAEYLLRYSAIDSRSDDRTLADTQVGQAVGSITNQAKSSVVGWFADGTDIKVKNEIIGKRSDSRARVGMIVPLIGHTNLSVSGGYESTNFASNDYVSNSTNGVGFEWTPSAQTQFAALREKRFFGHSHSILLSHRTTNTLWQYSDSKDVQILPTLLAGYNPGLIHELMATLLASSISDPLERNRAVRARLDAEGNSISLPSGGVQTSRLYVERQRTISAGWFRGRNSYTLLVQQRNQELLPFAPTAVDSFSQSDDIRERTATVAWSRRLTPVRTLNAYATYSKTTGMSVEGLYSSSLLVNGSINFRLSARAVASIGMWTNRLDSSASALDGSRYGRIKEQAAVVSLMQRF